MPKASTKADALTLRYAHLGTSQDFLLRFAPSQDKDAALVANPIACYEANHKRHVPTLGVAARIATLQRSTLIDWLSIQFLYTAEQFGSKGQLTYQQLRQAAADFLDLNPDLNPYEVMLYLRLLRAGQYGKVAYGKLTPNDLMAHTRTFRTERDQALALHYEQQRKIEQEAQEERMRSHAISYEQFQALKAAAQQGDAQAQQLLQAPAP